ncbi:hypothetical protein DICVIV_07371, partial [Dictyocaulus viviparus]
FRVEACPLFKQHQCQQHRPYTCFNWHFANQRRRRPQRKSDGSFNYSPDIYCDKYDENTGICPDGDECVYLHRVSGDVERKYHLRYYKTAQCVHPTDSRGQCVKFDQHEAGFSTTMDGDGRDRTSFVIEDPLWHSQDHVLSCYKTEQCRKPARLCRQGYACPFYHNSKDRRRPPAICKYRSTPCPAAKTVDEWLDPELCEAGDSCQYCHTRTEQQFHPEIYKSTKCNDMLEHGYCPRAVFCAFAHHDSELHVQRTPYVTSSQTSPKEQCSPNTTRGDNMRFGSPISNGTSTPTYSLYNYRPSNLFQSVLKQRHPIASKGYSATTDQISSSYPKAPGYERGPLSPNRSSESSMGRLRTHSLNMAHMDLGRRCNVGGFEALPGSSLPSHSSLCRSDSGFHAVTVSSVSSPMRIPGADSFHTSPLTSFGEILFGTTKSLLATPSQIAAFENQESGDVNDELTKTKIELRSHHEKVAIWEEGLKQARQACEAWKADAEHYKMKAEQAEMERNRAMFERDQLMQQLEAVKMHLASSGLSLGGLVSPQLTSSNEFGDGVLRAALQNSQPHNMFVLDDAIAPACARCGRDRSRADSRPGCPLCST